MKDTDTFPVFPRQLKHFLQDFAFLHPNIQDKGTYSHYTPYTGLLHALNLLLVEKDILGVLTVQFFRSLIIPSFLRSKSIELVVPFFYHAVKENLRFLQLFSSK